MFATRGDMVELDWARQLERELNEANRKLEFFQNLAGVTSGPLTDKCRAGLVPHDAESPVMPIDKELAAWKSITIRLAENSGTILPTPDQSKSYWQAREEMALLLQKEKKK